MQHRPFHPSAIRLQKQLKATLELRRTETSIEYSYRKLVASLAASMSEPYGNLIDMFADALMDFGLSVNQAFANLMNVQGLPAIALPDDTVSIVEDAPPVEVWRDGLRFDERGICIGLVDDFTQDAGE